ncbi:MAG: hypothetical protein AB7S75_24380 [Desulfococcaceae bacterium]
MAIDSTKDFPRFDTNNPTKVLEIPDNITRTFGNYTFSFSKGNKEARISKDNTKWLYNGDYFICVNGEALKDEDILNDIKMIYDRRIIKFIQSEIGKQQNETKEENVYSRIDEYKNRFANHLPITSIQLIQKIVYFSWHRCQVEDRLYPREVGCKGRKMFLDKIVANF